MLGEPWYRERYWQGEPLTGEGITHAVGVDHMDNEPIAACGRVVREASDYRAPAEQAVTCLRCWYRRILHPRVIRW